MVIHPLHMPDPSESSFLDNTFQFLQNCLLRDFLVSDFVFPRDACAVSVAEIHNVQLTIRVKNIHVQKVKTNLQHTFDSILLAVIKIYLTPEFFRR